MQTHDREAYAASRAVGAALRPDPNVDMLTVTLSFATPDKVAVKVRDDPAFSAIDDALDVNVTVGALSFSVIVSVTD